MQTALADAFSEKPSLEHAKMIPSRFYFLLLLFSRLLLFFLACSVCAFIFGPSKRTQFRSLFAAHWASHRSTLCRGLCRPHTTCFPSGLIVFHCRPRLALWPCPKSAFSPAVCRLFLSNGTFWARGASC